MIWDKKGIRDQGGAKEGQPVRGLFTCPIIPGECWSAAWDSHAKYLAVKLSANLAKVGIIPERDTSLEVTFSEFVSLLVRL
jgi:hypothetical protein